MKCLDCGTGFPCGIADSEPCWCSRDFPAVMQVPEKGAGCLCPACLARRIEQSNQNRVSQLPPSE